MSDFEDLIPERNEIKIPVIIKGLEKENGEWQEQTNVISHSKNNLGFTLTRKCQIGQLICLDTQNNFKQIIKTKEDEGREVWGVIQRCTSLGDSKLEKSYHIGIGIIGLEPPVSYFENPAQFYRVCGINYQGFWKVEESENEFVTRKHQRYLASVEGFIGLLNDSFNMEGGEKVLTENISFGGAAVFCNLNLNIGDCVKFISAQYEFTALSVVRNITRYSNNKQKVHLEFIAGRFPIEKLNL
jgi:hypothetical protein